ncbi:MAG: DUF547 domain-containing protein [Saprospiraceae bacterium]
MRYLIVLITFGYLFSCFSCSGNAPADDVSQMKSTAATTTDRAAPGTDTTQTMDDGLAAAAPATGAQPTIDVSKTLDDTRTTATGTPRRDATAAKAKRITIAQPEVTSSLSATPAPQNNTTARSTAPAQPQITATEVTATPAAPDHAAFDALLRKYVSSAGKVNYTGLKKEESKLDAYLAELAESIPQSDWGRSASLAYWINAYNAFTIKRILKAYPLKSIKDLDGGDPWSVKWITLEGKKYSLNQIENDIIRPRYSEPRIHFAVNCAAVSCPPLADKAFTSANLNSLLEQRAKAFINNDRYNQITADAAEVSKVFDWYGKDFGNLRNYLNKYATTDLKQGAKIEYKEYDWALNN